MDAQWLSMTRQDVNFMKLSGYSVTGISIEEIVHVTLAEVTFCATSVELRRMAEFLVHCANERERMGNSY